MRNTGYVGPNKVPARDLSTVRNVCFYKMDAPPTAHVKFHTCGPKCECPGGRFGLGVGLGGGLAPQRPLWSAPAQSLERAQGRPGALRKPPSHPQPHPPTPPPVSMEITDISPVPVEVFPGTGKMLFTPVYHIRVGGGP
jgi:hypothetical protein